MKEKERIEFLQKMKNWHENEYFFVYNYVLKFM